MAVIIELRPETELGLAMRAAEQGMSLAQYVSRLLEGQGQFSPKLSPADRAAAWREATKGLPTRRRYPTKRSAARRSTPIADEPPD